MAIPSITNNSPAPGYIAWGAFTIQLYGVAYAVPAASSNQRWIWWEYKNGTPVINAGPEVPDTITDDDLVLFANKNGIGVRVQSTNFIDGELLVDGSIFAQALSVNLINSQHIVTAGLDAGVIKFGLMHGDRITVNTLNGDRILANTITSGHITTLGLDAGVIKFGEMSGDRIVANTINGDHLVGEVILASTRIAALGPEGQSVELNPNGFFVYGPTSEGNPPYVSFPTEGGNSGKPNIISGTLQATTLSVDGNPVTGQAATFRLNSQLEPGATLTLNNSIVAPVAMPTAETVANEVAGTALTGEISGMTYNPADNCLYLTTNDFTMPGGVSKWTIRVYKFALATNTMSYVRTIQYGSLTDVASMGITYFNNSYYVGYDDGGDAIVVRYDNTWAQIASANFGPIGGDGLSFNIGNDGTNLWIADFGSSTANAIRFRKYLNTLSTAVQETVNTTYAPTRSARASTEIFSVNVGNFDFGLRKFIVTFNSAKDVSEANTTINYDMAAFGSSGGARELASEFHLMRKFQIPVLAWKGTSNNDTAGSFISVSTMSGNIPWVAFYSKLRLTARSNVWYAASSFYRVSGGSETTLSPQTSMTMFSRWNWKVTSGAPPSGMVARIYVGLTSGTAAARLQATLAAGVTSITSALFDAAGALAKTVSTFGSTVASSIQSQETITQIVNLGTTSGSTTVTGVNIQNYMVGKGIAGTGIQAGTTIVSAVPGVSAQLSLPATGTWTNINGVLTLPKLEIRGSGYARISELERVVITSTVDADTTSGNEPALRVGDISGGHLRIDGNEIIAMSSASAQGLLVLNSGGPVTMSGYIKTGVANTGTLVANTEKNISVVFPNPFPAGAPVPTVSVQVTDVTSLSSAPTAVPRSVTRNGFTITARRTTTSAFDVTWTAIAQ